MIKLILTAILSFGAFGCTIVTYSGPRLPKEQVATIDGWVRVSLTNIVCATEIDGLKIGIKTGRLNIEVLPGLHELRAAALERMIFFPFCGFLGCVEVNYHYGPVSVTFSAEAGREYALRGRKLETGAWDIWVEEGDSHVVVGSGTTDPTSWTNMFTPLGCQ